MKEIQKRLEKGNKILLRKTDPILSELSKRLEATDRKTIVIWSFLLVKEPASYLFARYPDVGIFETAIETVGDWAAGRIKMPEAKSAILALHNTASFIEDKADQALIHAIGQALSTVHTKKHAMGFVLYELTSIVLENGLEESLMLIPERIRYYNQMLDKAEEVAKDNKYPWADFLI